MGDLFYYSLIPCNNLENFFFFFFAVDSKIHTKDEGVSEYQLKVHPVSSIFFSLLFNLRM